jgi:hypothetical protein
MPDSELYALLLAYRNTCAANAVYVADHAAVLVEQAGHRPIRSRSAHGGLRRCT